MQLLSFIFLSSFVFFKRQHRQALAEPASALRGVRHRDSGHVACQPPVPIRHNPKKKGKEFATAERRWLAGRFYPPPSATLKPVEGMTLSFLPLRLLPLADKSQRVDIQYCA